MLNDMARQTTREQTSQLEAESVLPRRPWWLWGICLLVALGVAWFMLHLGSSGLPFRTAPGFQHFGAVPDFVLFERSGQQVTRADLLGKVWIASVIFTRCAEECPLVSSHMARLQGTLATEPDVRLVSITVDPAYDTPEVLTRYAQHFAAQPQRWLFLTGDQATIYRLVREGLHLGVVGPTEAVRSSALSEAERPLQDVWQWFTPAAALAHHSVSPRDQAQPAITHSARLVLVDRQGQIRKYYDTTDQDALRQLPRDVRLLLQGH